MNLGGLFALLLILVCGAAVSNHNFPAVQNAPESAPVVIPFELLGRHILIKARINNSDPLWFIFDTGDDVAIVDMNRARALGLNLHGEAHSGGAGPGSLRGSYVRNATLRVVGLEGNPQPVVLSLPLNLGPRLGHDIDGIIGAGFIKQFVVEVDYSARVLRLHDKKRFLYSGSGEIIPINLNSAGHPSIPVKITVAGRPAIKGEFVIDTGSGAALVLHRPFVEQQHLLGPAQEKTIRLLGGGGAGGKIKGRVGRIAGLRIGKFQIDHPPTLFSEDKGGAFASSEFDGNIGGQILSKFKILLDYGRSRIILEPNDTFKDLINPSSSGLKLVADGSDYKSFRVEEVLEESPATEAGLQKDDVILAVDGRTATELTLMTLNETLEKPGPHKLSVRRGAIRLQITLIPRRLI